MARSFCEGADGNRIALRFASGERLVHAVGAAGVKHGWITRVHSQTVHSQLIDPGVNREPEAPLGNGRRALNAGVSGSLPLVTSKRIGVVQLGDKHQILRQGRDDRYLEELARFGPDDLVSVRCKENRSLHLTAATDLTGDPR